LDLSTSSRTSLEAGLATIDIANHPIYLGVLGMSSAPLSYLLGCRGADKQWFTVTSCGGKLSKAKATMKQINPDSQLPPWLQLGSNINRPEYIAADPNKCMVVAVVGAELQATDRFAAGVTLRFPKVQAVIMTSVLAI
jgi:hypothetical protein